MIYQVEHITTYDYSQPAALSYNDLCLDLRTTNRQRVIGTNWTVEPEPSGTRTRTDFFGNSRRILSFERPMQRLKLTVRHRVEVLGFRQAGRKPVYLEETHPYLWKSPFVEVGPQFAAYADGAFQPGDSLVNGVTNLTRRIFDDFTYAPQTTTIGTTTTELLTTRSGVCQDYAHFALAVLRSLGIPARYVSGYLYTQPRPGQAKIYGADASHAWISVYDPSQGWIDFDPTNGVVVGDGHVTIAWGRDYGDVTPLRGVVLGGGAQTLTVMVNVTAAEE